MRLFINSKINKVNIKGEIELGSEIDKSVFNEHLEEILYFFQRTNYRVVIIEDLDRFNNTDIFTKLREINILLNKSEVLNGREISFIYAIRDEMFTDKTERVKFFEYIIPVIPFINPSNAGEQLTKLINESNLEEVLSKDFTDDVVTFIDDIDMRLLTNIFHEYVLYKDSLHELNQNNLFAIITFKNIFPEDFAKLHKREGYLFSLLSKKHEYIKEITDKSRSRINENENEIKKIQDEHINKITDLRAIYINEILNKTPNISSFIINGNDVSFAEIRKDEYFNILSERTDIKYKYFYYNNYRDSYYEKTSTTNYSFNHIENEVNPTFTYKEREQFINNREQDKINELKKEISSIEKEISSIESYSINELFQEIDIDEFIKDTPIDIPLIRNLLLNGHINESYNDYISIFHGINMTTQEFSFIRKVKSGIRENDNYELINIDQIIKKLDKRYFAYDAILNFDLFDYLSENYNQHKDLYTDFLRLMIRKTDNLKFIDNYIYSEREFLSLFIAKLSEYWNYFWNYIYEHPTFESEKKDYYLYLILTHAKLDSISSLNINLKLTDYIENHKEFISPFTDSTHYDKIISVLKELDIHFATIELPNDQNRSLFQYIYENNHYTINQHNIVLLLNYLPDIVGGSESIQCWNLTTILMSQCESLKNYIEDNLTDYLDKVFLKLPNNSNEAEETILLLLNNTSLSIELRAKVIDKQFTRITDNTKSDSLEIDTLLFEKNKVIASWNNIINYFDNLEDKVINDALVKFLNIEENYNALNKQDISKTNEEIEDLEKQLIFSNQLSIEAYKALVIKTPYKWNSINIPALDENKVEWLIQNKLSFTKTNFTRLKDDYPYIAIKLIEKHYHKLIEKYDELELDIDDHIKILQSTIINQFTKKTVIGKIENDWIIDNDTLKALILDILYKSPENILEYDVLYAIVEYSKDNEKRLSLIYNHIEGLDEGQIETLIKKIGDKYKKVFQLQNKPTFSYSPIKEKVFKLLETKEMISSCKVDKEKNEIKIVALYK